MDVEEFQSRLWDRLVRNGALDSLKASLRTKIIREVHHPTELPPPADASLMARAVDALIAQHLSHRGYDLSRSVFLPESHAGEYVSDALAVLQIPQRVVADTSKSQLECICAALGRSPLTVHSSTQTSQGEIANPLEHRLRMLDSAMQSRADVDRLSHSQSVDARFELIQRDLELRFQRQHKDEMDRWTTSEAARIRNEEAQRYSEMVQKLKTSYDAMHAERMGQYAAKERELQEQTDAKVWAAERSLYTERQRMYSEQEKLRLSLQELEIRRASFEKELELAKQKLSADRPLVQAAACQWEASLAGVRTRDVAVENPSTTVFAVVSRSIGAQSQIDCSSCAELNIEVESQRKELQALRLECIAMRKRESGYRELAVECELLESRLSTVEKEKEELLRRVEECSLERDVARREVAETRELVERMQKVMENLSASTVPLSLSASSGRRTVAYATASTNENALAALVKETELRVREQMQREIDVQRAVERAVTDTLERQGLTQSMRRGSEGALATGDVSASQRRRREEELEQDTRFENERKRRWEEDERAYQERLRRQQQDDADLRNRQQQMQELEEELERQRHEAAVFQEQEARRLRAEEEETERQRVQATLEHQRKLQEEEKLRIEKEEAEEALQLEEELVRSRKAQEFAREQERLLRQAQAERAEQEERDRRQREVDMAARAEQERKTMEDLAVDNGSLDRSPVSEDVVEEILLEEHADSESSFKSDTPKSAGEKPKSVLFGEPHVQTSPAASAPVDASADSLRVESVGDTSVEVLPIQELQDNSPIPKTDTPVTPIPAPEPTPSSSLRFSEDKGIDYYLELVRKQREEEEARKSEEAPKPVDVSATSGVASPPASRASSESSAGLARSSPAGSESPGWGKAESEDDYF